MWIKIERAGLAQQGVKGLERLYWTCYSGACSKTAVCARLIDNSRVSVCQFVGPIVLPVKWTPCSLRSKGQNKDGMGGGGGVC